MLPVDGRCEEVVDMDLATDWSEKQDQAFVRLGVRLKSQIAEVHPRFSWDGRQGFGVSEIRRERNISSGSRMEG